MNLEAWLSGLPKEEQLETAIYLLRSLTCDDAALISHYQTFGLLPIEAKIVGYLCSRAPNTCSREQIAAASGTDEGGLNVHISRIRRKGVVVRTSWGVGYAIERREAKRLAPPKAQPIQLNHISPIGAVKGRRVPWSQEEDKVLTGLFGEGLSDQGIAKGVGRSLRAVKIRRSQLGLLRSLQWSGRDKSRLAEWHDQGVSDSDIAARLTRDGSAVKSMRGKLGISRNSRKRVSANG